MMNNCIWSYKGMVEVHVESAILRSICSLIVRRFNGILFRSKDTGLCICTVPFCPYNRCTPAFRYIDTWQKGMCQTSLILKVKDFVLTKPDNQASGNTKSKKERESLPIITGVVDDCLNDIRSNHRWSTIRETEETEELMEMSDYFEHGTVMIIVPYCQSPAGSIQPSWFGKKRSMALGINQTQRCTPYGDPCWVE